MPDGIIRDPKMNPKEEDFGIVYYSTTKKHYKYNKTQHHISRYCLAGEDVEIRDIPSDPAEPEMIDGIPIFGLVTLQRKLPDQKGPVYKKLLPKLTRNNRKDAIQEAIDEGMETRIGHT